MKTLWLIPLLALAFAPQMHAQYALTEAGVRLAVGPALPQGANRLGVGPAATLAGFYTHYVCGKSYGYWLEGGLRYTGGSEAEGAEPSLLALGNTQQVSYSFVHAEGGAYLKLRKNNYHRKKELALLVGPKLQLRALSRATPADSTGASYASDGYRSVASIGVAAHLAVTYRMPLGKRSLIIHPGVEYSFLNWASASGAAYRNIYVFVGAGLVLWSSF